MVAAFHCYKQICIECFTDFTEQQVSEGKSFYFDCPKCYQEDVEIDFLLVQQYLPPYLRPVLDQNISQYKMEREMCSACEYLHAIGKVDCNLFRLWRSKNAHVNDSSVNQFWLNVKDTQVILDEEPELLILIQ